LFADIHSRRKKGRAELGRHMGAELVAVVGCLEREEEGWKLPQDE